MSKNKEIRPYNSAVIDNYLGFLTVKYPDIRINDVLDEASIQLWETTDPGHWFTQEQINAFHKALAARIKDMPQEKLAREVGRFTASKRSNKFLRLAVIHLLRPEYIFPISKKITAKFIKSVDVSWKKIHDSKYELTLKYDGTVEPKKFQCENFLGNVEAIIMLFNNKWPTIEHHECYFAGHDCCRYIISWEKEQYYYISKIRSILIFLSPIVALILFAIGSTKLSIGVLAIGIALVYHLKVYSELLKKRVSIEALKRNEFKILDLYDVMAKFHDYTDAFGRAAHEISNKTSVFKVLSKFTRSLQELGLKQGFICLYDESSSKLHLRKVFGYEKRNEFLEKELSGIRFDLGKIIKNIKMYESMKELVGVLPEKIAKRFPEITEPLFIPMVYEKSMIGVIVAQNEKGHENLTGSDVFLTQAVASQTALVITNIAAYETVTAAEKLKSEFLALASHELRTPIQAIFFAYDDLNDKLSRDNKKELEKSLGAIEKSVLRLETIIENMLNLGKIEAEGSLNEREVSIDKLFQQVSSSMEHVLSATGHELIIENEVGNKAQLICDSGLMLQVLVNLINNSVKFSEKNGKIIMRAYQGHAEICIDVIDDGFGVKEEEHEKIFMKFYQSNSSGPTIENDGCGLGLSICKEALQKHGGYIKVKSPVEKGRYPELTLNTKRKGSIFRLHLPLERLKK